MFKKEQYKPMLCPVCEDFYFSELREDSEDLGYFTLLTTQLGISDDIHQCSRCGWLYDSEQHENPDMKNGENELSLNEYRKWYKGKLLENPDYDYSDENCPTQTPHKCPVCGKHEFSDEATFDICPFCGWEDDPVMNDNPQYDGGANDLCLNEYKKRYESLMLKHKNYKWEKHGFDIK